MLVTQLKSSLITQYRTCNLCEAMCGLKIDVKGNKVHSIKGDKQDPFSQGHICPKAVALQDLYNDKDRLTKPVKKTKDGWQEISWKEAFKQVALKLKSTQKQYGRDAVGVYVGNPTVHNLEAMIYGADFFRLLGSKNRYSATSVDQLPHHLAAMLMFGHPLLLPIPDIDHTDFMVILGANPIVSNGSIMTVPNVKKRLKNIQKRQGKIITIDPRLTETGKIADQHLFIKPGTDAYLLMAMVNYLFDKQLINCNHLKRHMDDLDKIHDLVKDFNIENVALHTGILAGNIANLVEEFCQAKRAVLYARIGVSTHEFGSLANWLVNLFNILTGNMDSEGGMMFTTPAIDLVGHKKPKRKKFGRYFSRVSGYPETIGEFPVVALAEEILTPGDGQIKAMITAAGNPLLSTPNNTQLDNAFEQLDFMVSIDFYINETTKHADIILPPPSPLERPHYDLVFNHLAVRNYAKYSETLFEREKGALSEAQIFLDLTQAMAPDGILSKSKIWLKIQIMKWLGPEGILNKGIKQGPYGKNKHPDFKHLTLKKIQQHSHGMDLGALKACFPAKILTENGNIQLAPEEFVQDLERLKKKFSEGSLRSDLVGEKRFTLIGRRDPRTCNSWMHNSYRLVKGKPGCIAHMNDQDAIELKIQNGQLIKISSRVGQISLPVEVTDTMMPGSVSVPHGWGHGDKQTKMSIANAHTGVSVNQLTDEKYVDELTGNAALNGVPVEITPV